MNRRDILKRYHRGELTRDEALAELTAMRVPPKKAQAQLGVPKSEGDLTEGSE